MRKKHEKVCTTLNHVKHLLILASTVTGCVSICASFNCRNQNIEVNYKKKTKKHDKKMLLGKANLNAIEFLLSKALIDIYISHDEFVSVNNVLRENNEKKEEIKNPETSMYPI